MQTLAYETIQGCKSKNMIEKIIVGCNGNSSFLCCAGLEPPCEEKLINNPFNPELINNALVHVQVTNVFDFLYVDIEVLYDDIERFSEFCPVEEILSDWVLYHVRNTKKFLKERKRESIWLLSLLTLFAKLISKVKNQ